jgi:calcium-binding protein CML
MMTSKSRRACSAVLQVSLFLALFAALVAAQVAEKKLAPATNGPGHEAVAAEGEHQGAQEEGEESEAEGGQVAVVAAVTISTLVAISILFEISTEQLKEHTDELNMPFVNTVFGELTTLGFIGLLLFVVTKIEVLPWLSRSILGASSELQEIIEKLHMALFLFIVIFLVLCLGLLRLGMHVQHEWREFERSSADIPSVLSEYALATEPPKSWLNRFSWHRTAAARKAEREVVYLALRRRFMDYRSNHPDEETARQLAKEFQLLGGDSRFPFNEYLSIISGEVMGRLIQIDMATWLALDVVLTVLLGLCWHAGPQGEVVILLLAGFSLIALNEFVYRRVNAMRCLLTPSRLQHDAERLRRKSAWRAQHGLSPLTNGDGYNHAASTEKTWLLTESEEVGRDCDDAYGWSPPYVDLLPNGGRDLSEKELKQRQRSLIGGGWGNGVVLALFSTRMVFLLTALHLSTFLLRETYQISELFAGHPALGALLCFLFLLPSIVVPSMSTRIARDGLLAFNVEHMKVSRVIVQVTRLLRARQTLRTLRFVAEMKIHLQESVRRNSEQLKMNIELMPEVPMPQPSRRRSSIMPIDASATFKAARRRSSTHLDPTVAAGVLRSIQKAPPPLKLPPTAATAPQPPLSPLAAYLTPREKRGDAYRREMERREIHTIFCLFDVDGSGSVSRDEMASLLLAITHDLEDMQLNRLMTDLVAEELDSDDENLGKSMVEGPQEITFEAFYKWCSARIQESRHTKEELVEEIFTMVDADGSGTISVDEFVSIFKTLGQALDHDDVRELVYQMDRNGDGKIDLEEFSKMLQKHEV